MILSLQIVKNETNELTGKGSYSLLCVCTKAKACNDPRACDNGKARWFVRMVFRRFQKLDDFYCGPVAIIVQGASISVLSF